MTGALAISWSAPPEWRQVPPVGSAEHTEWRAQALERERVASRRRALATDLDRLAGHIKKLEDGRRAWMVIFPPSELGSTRVVGLARWDILTGARLDELERAAAALTTGPGEEIRSQRVTRASVAGRDSVVVEQLLERERSEFARGVVQRCLSFTETPDPQALLSLTLDTADLGAFEDLASTCAAVLATVRFAETADLI